MPKVEEGNLVLDEALRLYAAGYWVVPQMGKRAVALGWDKWRLGEDDLKAYLGHGGMNIAIALHQSEIMDVECDTDEAENKLRSLVPEGYLQTPTWRSRRGRHRLFLRPPGLPDRASVHASGIEFRIGNKACLSTVPPSRHETGVAYLWEDGLSIWDIRPSPLPGELVDLLEKAKKPKVSEAVLLGAIPEGCRNDELFRYGCRLLARAVPEADLRNALIGCNKGQCRPPLSDVEVESIIKSVEEKRSKKERLEPARCESWKDLRNAWKKALFLTESVEHALAVCVAVCMSTEQQGDNQLFLQLIGAPGSAKTKLCDALVVSKKCYLLEHLKGFHSGWKTGFGDGEDFSLLARINHKTLITPEADVMISSPNWGEVMSQQRRIFDGSSGASYKTLKEDRHYEGLRTPWIMAGTPVLLHGDQSRLGDRFLRVIIDPPSDDDLWSIQEQVAYSAMASVKVRANCSAESVMSPEMREAYRMTGGYIDYIRDHAEELLSAVKVDPAVVVKRCSVLGRFTGKFRARPDPNRFREEKQDVDELPTRLTGQFMRLAVCLAAALGRKSVDNVVLGLVRKVAVDSAKGRTLEVAKVLLPRGKAGAESKALGGWVGEGDDKILGLLRFLTKIGVTETFTPKSVGDIVMPPRWRLTPAVEQLCRGVLV